MSKMQIMAPTCADLKPGRMFDIQSSRDFAQSIVGKEKISELVQFLEKGEGDLSERIACAAILSLVGDPRLAPGELPQLLMVPGGVFRVGLELELVDAVVSEFDDIGVQREWIMKEVPAHEVSLSSFLIGKYPVTNVEYQRFLQENPHRGWPSSWPLGICPLDRYNHPVHTISPQDAEAYCEWLSSKTGRRVRLPTESEWEYAAGKGKLVYPWGDEFDPAKANTAETGLLTTSAVGLFPAGASPCGAHDMAGNVEEYVQDNYSPYPGGSFVIDDLNRQYENYRICRGGGFGRFRDLARNKRRHGMVEGSLYSVGFRVAVDC